jgi:hypothetical protein
MDETRKILQIRCGDCGELFLPTRKWQKFCSEKCRNNFHNYSRIEDKISVTKITPTIKCPHCLTEDTKMFEELSPAYYLCNVCSREFYDV